MNFFDQLLEKFKDRAPFCVGLDPFIDKFPKFLMKKKVEEFGLGKKAIAEAIIEFNRNIVDAVKDVAPAIKLQAAMFEEHGAEGYRAMEESIRYVKENNLIPMVDAKRGDIGSTTGAYAKAWFSDDSPLQVGALTVQPYLGEDSISPYYPYFDQAHAIFVMVKTSNPSSVDLQDQEINGQKVYEVMGALVEKWGEAYRGQNGFSAVGAVVGATYPEEAKKLRDLLPHTFFLVPGYGKQGGSAEMVKNCFNSDGVGAIINSSRGINFAYLEDNKFTEKDYQEAAREAAIKMSNDLKKIL